ncbi:MAG: hypothetical protein ACXW13_08745 [Burkholderiaceae bacterium]
MDTIGLGIVAAVLIVGIFKIQGLLQDILKEVKGLRFQMQETFTPDDPDGGPSGHPKAIRYLLGEILTKLKQFEFQLSGTVSRKSL